MRKTSRVFFAFIVFFFITSLACTMGVPVNIPFVVTPTATPLPLPPVIVETDPPVGSQIGLQQSIAFFFNQPMDRTSVETALKMDLGQGVYVWIDDSTVTFTPLQPLPADSPVNFTLSTGASAANGLILLEAQSFSFSTPTALSITQTLPAPSTSDIRTDSAVVVSFNQPIVPLGADPAGLPVGFSMEPSVNGKGEWLNTSTYIFHPEPGLDGGANYIVRVNPSLKSLAGLTLGTTPEWSFNTSMPRVVDITPYNTSPLILDPEFTITFNQPMDKTSVEADFRLGGPSGKVAGSFEWNENATQAVFKPAGRLPRSQEYTLNLSPQSRSKGGLGLESSIQNVYNTYPSFSIAYTEPFDGGSKSYSERAQVIFSSPLKDYLSAELDALLTVSPTVSNLSIYSSDQTVNLYGEFDPDILYTVSISADLEDAWGMRLGQAYSFRMRSTAPEPGLMQSYYPLYFVRPEDPQIGVQITNLSFLEVSNGSISPSEYFLLNQSYQERDSYYPANTTTWTDYPQAGTGTSVYGVRMTLAETLPTGLYLARIDSGLLGKNFRPSPMFLLSSNVNLTFKLAADGALVWAVDLRTNLPLVNVPLSIVDQNGALVASGQSNSDGLWQVKFANKVEIGSIYYAVLAEPGDDLFGLASTAFNIGISPWDFDINSNFYDGEQNKVYLYTDRPIYRPGQVVSFRGIARVAFNGRYIDLPQQNPWDAVLKDSQGREIQTIPVSISAYGGFDGQFTLPESALPGGWSIQIQGNKQASDRDDSYSVYFDVADYRKPEVNLSIALTPQDALQGQTILATIRADYFFGAPAADLPFTWTLYRDTEYFSIPGFQTGIYDARWLGISSGRFGLQMDSGAGRTASDGTFGLELTSLKLDGTSRFWLEVTASESGGYPISARESVVVHPAATYPGIRPAQWVGRAKTPLGFTLTAVDLSLAPQTGKSLQVELQKVNWVRRKGDEYSYYPRYEKVTTPVESKSVTTGQDGLAAIEFTPPDPGTYLVRAAVDGNVCEVLVWVGGQGQAIWPTLPFDQIRLTGDQTSYQPGQTASIFVPNPFEQEALALVTSERGALLSSQLVKIPAGGESVKIALTDDNAPNTYIAVTLLGPDTQFKQGYLNIEVDAASFVLNVDIKATPEKASPGQPVTLDLRVTDSKDQPVQGEFSLAVVDLAALALAAPNAPDIVPAFYNIQPLAVRTGLTAAVYGQRFIPPLGGKGGGGGEGAITIRDNFPDTALWTTFVTDANGTSQITLTLPDSLTTWQVDTRGLDHQTRVGQARLNIISTKDLLLRPLNPRYFVVGDHVQVSTFVNNNTANNLKADVTLQATGAALDDQKSATQKVDVPANGRTLVSWWVTAGDAASADLVFTVKAGDLTDATRPQDGAIPILRYSAPQAFTTAGVLPGNGSKTEIISLPRSFSPLGGDLTVELAPSLGAYLLNAAQELAEPDEFSSNDAIASYLLANLAIIPALRDAGIPDTDVSGREAQVQSWADKLIVQQNNDGGWNWYRRGQWGENPSDPIMTAHITYTLGKVAQSGLGGDLENALNRAKSYLYPLMQVDPNVPDPELNQQAFYMLAYYDNSLGQSFGSLHTARKISGNGGEPIDDLFELRERLSPTGQAYMALAYLGRNDGGRASSLLANLSASANRTSTGAFWENPNADWLLPGTPVYTTAVIVHALSLTDPASPLMTDAIRYLAANRSANQAWGGTMQTAWVLRALSSALVGTGEFQASFPFSATLNTTEIARGQAESPQTLTTVSSITPLSGLYLNDPNELKIMRETGAGKLYYRAALTVLRPAESAPALNKGISVSRAYYDCSSLPCRAITAWQMNPEQPGKITVRVTITLPHDMYYLNVEDFAPAGAEIVNPTLKTSQQGEQSLEVEFFAPDDPYANGWGWWYFDTPKIYRDHIHWSADYLEAGTYVLSYSLVPSLPGEYRALPAHAWMSYFPEVQGTSAGSVFEIK